MARKDRLKEALMSLLDEAQPLVEEDTLSLGKLKIHCTESGYANITIPRPLDIEFVKQHFEGMDIFAEGNQGSISVKKNANIFLYAEGPDSHRIAFGPVLDYELLLIVFKYIRSVLTRGASSGGAQSNPGAVPTG